ncbi:tryptophan synthase subunit alpha [Xanthomonas sp. Kuri4-1]
MRRIDETFHRLRASSRKALIPFVTAGDPSLEATVPVMHALARAGADIIELGVPFSDPMADGPTIQRSSERALGRGAGLGYVLEAVHEFRRDDAVTPVVLMGYLNPVEIHGTRRFAEAAVAAGVDGLLLVDLPPEEAAETREIFAAAGLALIMLASPTTDAGRLAMLAEAAQGYLYYVSFAGVTGASERLDTRAAGDRAAATRPPWASWPAASRSSAATARSCGSGAACCVTGSMWRSCC